MLRIVFFGGGEFAVVIAAAVAAAHEVCLVVSPPPQLAGRKQTLTSPPVAVWAQEAALPMATEYAAAAAAAADCFVVCDYGKLLPPALLQVPRYGALNVHPSLLPRWRGAAPVERAILAGDEKSGVSIIRLSEVLDGGDILAQREIVLPPTITGGALRRQTAEVGAALLLEVLAMPESFPPIAQDASQVTYAAKVTTTDRYLDFTAPAAAIDRRVRAFAPSPAAHCFLAGERVKVYAATVIGAEPAEPGVLLSADDERGIVIACGVDALRLDILQRAGRRMMTAAELLRGFPLQAHVGTQVIHAAA